ncbi:hypothetical protein PX52LOC_06391 [Limnoglobus roseus]|uniref:Uncharacterized protein n=1 Tax=Limnoglobus roseus TaxID=2598579 RepID=A0A5C1AMB9_9BACT|nr:hypothetical protein PX52LOC_06391 [Limnoglobus roseus]
MVVREGNAGGVVVIEKETVGSVLKQGQVSRLAGVVACVKRIPLIVFCHNTLSLLARGTEAGKGAQG